MTYFVFNLQTFKTDTSSKNDRNFTCILPNLMNDILNKTYWRSHIIWLLTNTIFVETSQEKRHNLLFKGC